MPDENSQHQACEVRDSSPAADGLISRERLERIVAYLEVQLAELDRREQQLHRELACLDGERRKLHRESESFEERVREQDAALTQRERAVAESESANQLLSRQLQQEQQQLAGDLRQFEADRQAFQQEQSTWQERCEREIADRGQELERREAEVHRRAVDLEKRSRFHEGHLEKLRRELEAQKRELDAARQQQRLHHEQSERQIGRRLTQIRRYRELIEQRDVETRNLKDALHAAERAQARNTAKQLELLSLERARLDERDSTRLEDFELQADILRAKELELERREARLDAARNELQRLQRESTESRIAAETAWSQLCEAGGAEDADQRLAGQRRLLDEQLQAWEKDGRDRLHQLQAAAEEFRTERDAAAKASDARWQRLSRREESLRELEEAVARALARLSERLNMGLNESSGDETRVVGRMLDELEGSLEADHAAGGNAIESDAA